MKILFLHGWHSVPGGLKPTNLRDHGHEVINPALDDDDFAKAVKTAQDVFDKHQPQVVVGSSRGGAVAMNINSGDAKLVLLCPAWKNWGTAKTVRPSTVILHSRADDVVPFADSEELSKINGATLIEVGDDHRAARKGDGDRAGQLDAELFAGPFLDGQFEFEATPADLEDDLGLLDLDLVPDDVADRLTVDREDLITGLDTDERTGRSGRDGLHASGGHGGGV